MAAFEARHAIKRYIEEEACRISNLGIATLERSAMLTGSWLARIVPKLTLRMRCSAGKLKWTCLKCFKIEGLILAPPIGK